MPWKEGVVVFVPMIDYVEKEVSITTLYRKPRAVYEFLDTTGNIVILSKRGKRVLVMMSVETYAQMTGCYEETMESINALCQTHREKGVTHE